MAPYPDCPAVNRQELRTWSSTGTIPGMALFGLRCRRTTLTLLDAVGEVCDEVNTEHGIRLNDLGIEKLWEWTSDGPDGFGATIAGQLLLMAAHRAHLVGYSTADLVRFLISVAPDNRS